MSGATEESAPDAGQGEIGTPSSLTGQKRPRDYGEQLKGLSQSDDEGVQNEKSSPALKKQKTDYSDGDNGSDLDDGEIVESSPASNPRPSIPQNAQSTTQLVAASLGELEAMTNPTGTQDASVNTFEPSEDGEIDSNVADDLDKPFFIDTTGTGSGSGSGSMQHSGWNQGVSVGARTSFGKSTSQLFPGNASRAHTTLSSSLPRGHDEKDEDDDEDDYKDHDYQPPPSPTIDWFKDVKQEPKPYLTFSAGNVTWNLRRQTFRVKKRHASDGKTFWGRRLESWVLALAEANENMADRITVEVVKTGFNDHLNNKGIEGLLTGSKHHVNKLRPIAQETLEAADLDALILKAQKSLQKKQAQSSEGKATGKKSTSADGSIRKGAGRESSLKQGDLQTDTASIQKTFPLISNGGVRGKALSADEELRLQRRYFPFADDPSRFCLSCSGVGHKSSECPLLQCKFCGSREHTMYACPTRRRCSKCRQLGHSSETCNEKLALASEEQDGCAFCGADHSDEQCTEIWRSFDLVTGIQKKVKDIPAFCYTCGGSGHYGPECGLPDRGGKVTGTTSWSQENRSRNVDPNSENVALGWIDVDTAPSRSSSFHILGRARKRVHTHFVSSDDSEEDLVHAPIQRPGRRGDIRISSNIGSIGQGGNRGRGARHSNDQSRRRQNEREFSLPPPPPSRRAQGNGDSWQPPLPPGPPPQRGRNGFERPLAPPPGSLPPRPQTFDSGSGRGSSNRGGQNGRGGRGGFRGGSRGGGRGRSRGRGK
ncbi:hypothetical protein F4781DRAFT_388705 [Annulohypoxylon bovei var. microspora]|nr:hypothetical protein F4781DRAFT_388705 [Annulohypoxylon bovei var. microspora]